MLWSVSRAAPARASVEPSAPRFCSPTCFCLSGSAWDRRSPPHGLHVRKGEAHDLKGSAATARSRSQVQLALGAYSGESPAAVHLLHRLVKVKRITETVPLVTLTIGKAKLVLQPRAALSLRGAEPPPCGQAGTGRSPGQAWPTVGETRRPGPPPRNVSLSRPIKVAYANRAPVAPATVTHYSQ